MSAPTTPNVDFPNQIPKVSKWMRTVNIVIIITALYMSWYIQLFSFLFGVLSFSGAVLPVIYWITSVIAIPALSLTLAGNGLKVYSLCWIPPLISIIAGIVFINTQIYLYTIAISVLGFKLVFELTNFFHFMMIIIIIVLLVSPFLSVSIASQLRDRNKWLKDNQLVWVTQTPAGNQQLSPVNNAQFGQMPVNGQQSYPSQQ